MPESWMTWTVRVPGLAVDGRASPAGLALGTRECVGVGSPGYQGLMTEPSSQLLPVLALDDMVVLPHMTVPIGVPEEQRAPLEAARQGSHLILLVPRVDGQFRSIGTVASVQES